MPADVPDPEISQRLCADIEQVLSKCILRNEASNSLLVQAILMAALDYSHGQLSLSLQSRLDAETARAVYQGRADYKRGIVDEKAIWQTLAKAACLQRKRKEEGKDTPVFAVLTNVLSFRFFIIDTDSRVMASYPRLLDLLTGTPFRPNSTLIEIMKWFSWFITSIMQMPSRASRVNRRRG